MKTPTYLFLLIILVLTFHQTDGQTTYTNFGDFKSALENAKAGDEIILADGVYNARSVTIKTVNGTAENPVIIRSETIGGAVLNTGTYFDLRACSHITFQGFQINISEKSTTFKLQASNHIRLTQNTFDGSGETEGNSSVWVIVQGLWDDNVTLSHHNKIDHNVFKNKQTLGNMIRIDGTDEKQVSQYDVIEYNYFKNMGPRATNEMEAIRIGWSAMSESDGFCTVSHNLFEACNGDPEIISVKCNKNTIAHNTFRRCQGTLSLRHGNESVIEGNFFLGEGAEGTGGVRIYGSDHKIINNHFEGLTGTKWDAPITLTKGDAEEGNSGLTKHFRIERAIIANNTLMNNSYGIEVGYTNQGKYSKAPRDVVMAYNIVSGITHSMVNYITPPDHMQWIDNVLFPTGSAILGDGVSFTNEEVIQTDPLLKLNAELGYTKATSATPQYSPNADIAGTINSDIDGQQRRVPTQYGADEFSMLPVLYAPLSAKDVGPSTGEFLYTSTASMQFPVEGDSAILPISSNLDWTVSTTETWLNVAPNHGSSDGSIRIKVQPNNTGLMRNANVIITPTNGSAKEPLEQVVLIEQADKVVPFLEMNPQTLSFPSKTSSSTFEVTSNTDWIVSTDINWVEITPLTGTNNATVTISTEENPTLSKRSGTISISDGLTLKKTIDITQDASVGTEEKINISSLEASTEQSGNEAVHLIDGDLTNRWSGEGDGAYVTLDLGQVKSTSYIKVGLYKGNSRTSTFDVLTSEDGVNFTYQLTGITTEVTEDALVLYDFDNVDARYVRIVGHGNSTSAWNSYTEFEVWGWNTATPTDKIAENYPIRIFPNPSKGWIQIQGISQGNMSIYRLDGTKVYHSSIQNNDIKYTRLTPGIYLVHVHLENRFLTHKLIIK